MKSSDSFPLQSPSGLNSFDCETFVLIRLPVDRKIRGPTAGRPVA